jgi:hypothetical protein
VYCGIIAVVATTVIAFLLPDQKREELFFTKIFLKVFSEK